AAQRRRARLAEQRAGLRRCEAQHAEATEQLRRAFSMAAADPRNAAGQARELTSAMLDKMLVDGELCIRLLSSQAGDRMTAHALNVTVVSMLMGRALGLGPVFLLGIAAGAVQAAWHYTLIRSRSREGCFHAFRQNHWLGLAVFCGVAADLALR
ncbi:MAG: hypothetical protein JNL98_45165, partial [Bryobacterales bacterium]|nr:hypothetical protein [Bryobacterales bacterium]